MRRGGPLIALMLIAAAGYVLYGLLWPGAEARLRGTIDDLAATASRPREQSDLAGVARAAQLAAYLAPDLRVEAGPPVGLVEGREAVLGVVAKAPMPAGLTIGFVDLSIDMDGDERSARVVGTLRIEQPDPRGGAPLVDAREVDMTWIHPASSWVLQRATVVRPLH